MSTAQAIDFKKMYQENELDNVKLQKDQSPANVDAISKRVQERYKLLAAGYDRSQKTEDRAQANQSVRALQDTLKAFVSEQFPEGSELDSIAFNKVSKIKREINKMIMHPDSEKKIRDMISDLYLKDDKSGHKYIAKDHQTMQDLWNDYYDKQGRNYIAYLQSNERNEERDAAIIDKIQKNQSKFKAVTQQALMNLLEQSH